MYICYIYKRRNIKLYSVSQINFYSNDILIIRILRVILMSRFVCLWCNSPHQARASNCTRFLDHKQQRTTFGECSARRRKLHLTTHNTPNRQTSMQPVGFEPTISAGELPKTYALDRAATGTRLLSRQTSVFREIYCFLLQATNEHVGGAPFSVVGNNSKYYLATRTMMP